MTTSNFGKRRLLCLAIAANFSFLATDLLAKDITVDIKGQPLVSALKELGKQTSLQLLLSKPDLKTLNTVGVSGTMTIEDALQKLLSNTGLTYQYISEDTVVVKVVDSDGEEETGKEETDENEREVDEEVVTTGSAIRNTEPTSHMDTYTAEDLAKMGVSSIEDFMRKMPQNYSGINTLTTTGFSSAVWDAGGSFDSQGTSSANLYGLGADATLVLINGRRTAESAQYEGGVINLSGIPISAIERVEVVLDGASARYGSDAVGGVINFITKKDYAGAETSVRVERGLNGGDKIRFSQIFGYNWNSGGITATLTYEDTEPVNTFKAGQTTHNHTSRGGRDWRSPFSTSPQPGAVYALDSMQAQCAEWDINPPPWAYIFGHDGVSPGYCEAAGIDRNRRTVGALLGSLPQNHDGVSWGLDDLSLENMRSAENLRFEEGVTSQMNSLSLSVNQDITDGINVFADILYSINKTDSQGTVSGLSHYAVWVPTTNAFNDTGRELAVNYFPVAETETGLAPGGNEKSDAQRADVNLGFTAEMFGDWQVRANYRWSMDKSENTEIRAYIHSFYATLPEPTGNAYTDAYYQRRTEAYARFLELLASDDPNEAINPFGNGSVQSPFLGEIYGDAWQTDPASYSEAAEITFDGSLIELPAGIARMALGIEFGKEYRDHTTDTIRQGRFGGFAYTEEPSRDRIAVFTEFDVPLIDVDQEIPFVAGLQLNMSVRWEEFSIFDGYAINSVNLLTDEVGVERIDVIKFSNTSPRVGIKWDINDEFMIRVSWGESFRAPTFTEMLGYVNERIERIPYCTQDRGHPDYISGAVTEIPIACNYGILQGANPNLQPEVADITSYGFEWTPGFIDGLRIAANVRETDYGNRIGSVYEAYGNDYAALMTEPDYAVRWDNGDLNYFRLQDVNFASRVSKTVDINTSYDFSTDWGDFRANLSAVYTSELYNHFRDDLPQEILVGFDGGPQQWKGRVSLDWARDTYGANMYFNYTGSYINSYNFYDYPTATFLTDLEQKIGDYWTLDLTGYYGFGDGWRVEGGAIDITANKPNFFESREGYDLTVWNAVGRKLYVEMKKSFDF